MSSSIASGITQTLPLPLTGKPHASTKDEMVAGSSTAGMSQAKEGRAVPADTISISSQLRQTINDVQKDYVKMIEPGKENSSEKSGAVVSKVQFAYDMKGDLSVRYMDASNNLIYQAPSELMIRMKEEAASRLDTSVDTKA